MQVPLILRKIGRKEKSNIHFFFACHKSSRRQEENVARSLHSGERPSFFFIQAGKSGLTHVQIMFSAGCGGIQQT